MNYDYGFDALKILYDKYTIEKDSESNKTVIVNRKTRELWEYEGIFATCVNFAHIWVIATHYNPFAKESSSSKGQVSEDDYGVAFSEMSRKTYIAIMAFLVAYWQEFRRMPKCETLVKETENPDAQNIIRGLYSKKSWYASLVFWSLKVAGMEELLEDLLEKMQEKSSDHSKKAPKEEEYHKPLAA